MRALIGVDIGTQGTKAALFDEAGQCLAQAFIPSKLHRPEPGVVEEDPKRQVDSVCKTIRKCVKNAGIKPENVAGIGIAGQMAGVIGVGRNGRHITPYDSWLDTRCGPQIEQMSRMARDEVLAKTGCAPSFNHGPKKLWWKKNRVKTFRRIAAFVQPGAYAAMRLCGLDSSAAFIDKTYLHFSGFADNPKGEWDETLCRRFEMDMAKLPRIVDPQVVVGEIGAIGARRCGLKTGVPVVAGCGDTAASFLSCGAVHEGIGVDVAGTASVFAATTTSFRPDRKNGTLGCGRSAVPGLWHPYAYISGGGMNLEWFRQEIAGSNASPASLRNLDAHAAKIRPELSDPLFVPHLGGRACPTQPSLRGAWVGLGWNHTAAHLYRAVLESIAIEYAGYQRVLRSLYPSFKMSELRVTGGGAKSDFWNGIKADVLQTTVRRIARDEGAPRGAAMLAGRGVGVLKNLPTASRVWIAAGAAVRGRASMASHYTARLATYERTLKQLSGIAGVV